MISARASLIGDSMNLEKLILRVGKKYKQASKELKINVGRVMDGNLKLNYKRYSVVTK